MVMKVPVRPTPALHVCVNTHKSSKMARVLSVTHTMHTIMNINKEDLKMWRFEAKSTPTLGPIHSLSISAIETSY